LKRTTKEHFTKGVLLARNTPYMGYGEKNPEMHTLNVKLSNRKKRTKGP